MTITIREEAGRLYVSAEPDVAQRLGYLFTREKIKYTWDGVAAAIDAKHRSKLERWARKAQVAVEDLTPPATPGPASTLGVLWVKAGVRDPDPAGGDRGLHTVAWLESEGWFCDCDAHLRCPAIATVREALNGPVRPVRARTRRPTGEGTPRRSKGRTGARRRSSSEAGHATSRALGCARTTRGSR